VSKADEVEIIWLIWLQTQIDKDKVL